MKNLIFAFAIFFVATEGAVHELRLYCHEDGKCPNSNWDRSYCPAGKNQELKRCNCSEGSVVRDDGVACVQAAKALDEECGDDNDCEKMNARCINQRCTCPKETFTIAKGGDNKNYCRPQPLREYCAPIKIHNGDCSEVYPEEDCGYGRVVTMYVQVGAICRCPLGGRYVGKPMRCSRADKKLGERCSKMEQCFNPFNRLFMTCEKGKCACVKNAHEGVDGTCYHTLDYGESCYKATDDIRKSECFRWSSTLHRNVLTCLPDSLIRYKCGCVHGTEYNDNTGTCEASLSATARGAAATAQYVGCWNGWTRQSYIPIDQPHCSCDCTCPSWAPWGCAAMNGYSPARI